MLGARAGPIYTMYRRSAAGDAVAGPNSPGEPLAFLQAVLTFVGAPARRSSVFGWSHDEMHPLTAARRATRLPRRQMRREADLLGRVVTPFRDTVPLMRGPSTRRLNNSTTRVEAV